MSAEVLQFPGSARHRPVPPPLMPTRLTRPAGRRHYSFVDVCGLLTLVGQQRTQIAFLRDLHTQCGMPEPTNPRRWGGSILRGPAAIDSRSVWCAMEFDAWLDSRRSPPPAAFGADVPPLPQHARQDMAQRARLLAGGER